jgi:hypothetical protein
MEKERSMENIIDTSHWYPYVSSLIEENINPYKKLEFFIGKAEEAIYKLPYYEIKPILDFKLGLQSGYLLLKGFQKDPNLIPTYESENRIFSEKKTFFSEFWLAIVAKILGEPIGYAQEKNGEVFQNIRPRKGQESKIASDSSQIILDLHVENGYHPVRPDYLLLYGLRQDPQRQAYTLAVEIKKALQFFTDEEIYILRSRQFKTSVDWNFGNIKAERGAGPIVSILFGDEENPMVFYDDEYVSGMTPDAQKVLDKFRGIIHEHMQHILLKPGEMLIFDNYKCLHGRTSFQPYYDGNDRWLQRLLVVRDLSVNQKLLNTSGRILNWQYKPNEYYGNVVY